jgi:hypothetical protein
MLWGEDYHSPCTFHVFVTISVRILTTFRSRLQASSSTAVFRSAFRHSSPTDGLGVLAIADAMGIFTWRAVAAALWIASVEDTAALTYDFDDTHSKTSLYKNRFCMFTWLLRISNTFIYMSFRVAQDHNKAAGRDTTSSMTSWTQQEDLAATMQRRSFSFIYILNCLKLSNLFCFHLSWTILSCYSVWLYILAVMEAPRPEKQPKYAVVKKIKLLYSSISTNIRDYSSVSWRL